MYLRSSDALRWLYVVVKDGLKSDVMFTITKDSLNFLRPALRHHQLPQLFGIHGDWLTLGLS